MKFMSWKDYLYCVKNINTNREEVMKMIEERNDAWDELFRVGKYMACSECGKANEKTNNYCISCNHKLKDIPKKDKVYREYCPICKEMITPDMKYCGEYGHEIRRNVKDKICPICGEMVVNERYCINCGHDFFENVLDYSLILKSDKVCPNCNEHYSVTANYCIACGTKLKEGHE